MPDGQFYGAIIWYHLMAPFYGMCVPGITKLFFFIFYFALVLVHTDC